MPGDNGITGTWDGDMGASALEGPSPAVPAEATPKVLPLVVLQPAQLKVHGASWVEADAGDAQRCGSWWGWGSSKNWSMGLTRATLATKNNQGEGKDHVGWGHQPSPAKGSMVRPGSDTGSKNGKRISALISSN